MTFLFDCNFIARLIQIKVNLARTDWLTQAIKVKEYYQRQDLGLR